MNCLLVIIVFCLSTLTGLLRKCTSSTQTVELVEKVLVDNGEMATNYSGNRFMREFDQLLMYLADLIDHAVCKSIDSGDLPVLVAQEQNHARAHNIHALKPVWRFQPFRMLLTKLLLRSSRKIRLLATCAIESSATVYVSLLLLQPLIPRVFCKTLLYHLLEEAEHGCVTVDYLLNKVSFFERLLFTPIAMMLMLGFAVVPVLTHVVHKPTDIFSVFFWWELGMYSLVSGRATLASWDNLVGIYATPFNVQGETIHARKLIMQHFEQACKTQNVEYVTQKKAFYTISAPSYI